MSAPDPFSLDDFAAIPDPARPAASKAPPAPPAPAEPSPTRADRRRRSAVALGLAVAWIGVTAWRFGLRGDVGDTGVLGALVVWTLVGGAGLALALRPGGRGMPPSLRVVQLILAGLGLLYLVIVLVRSASAPEVPLTWMTIKGCFSTANFMALGPLVLASIALRRSFLSVPVWRGAVVGAICGLGGAIGIQAHCAVDTASHVLMAHGLVIVVAALFGGILGAVQGRL